MQFEFNRDTVTRLRHLWRKHEEWSITFGIEARAVEHNIFLEGSSDTNAHTVEAEDWVGDVSLAASYKPRNWDLRFSFQRIDRTKEFDSSIAEGQKFWQFAVDCLYR